MAEFPQPKVIISAAEYNHLKKVEKDYESQGKPSSEELDMYEMALAKMIAASSHEIVKDLLTYLQARNIKVAYERDEAGIPRIRLVSKNISTLFP